MPKMNSVAPMSPTDTVQRKTERSHEENQERAYIAASRRTDRSIEARVQSARMASDIHKKRTGKSFKINEEIVLKEEMYEEEDDDLPRSYRLLSANMETPSRNTNDRLEAYLNNRVAMSTLLAKTNEEWRENEINKLFAQSFPHMNASAQQQRQQHQQQQQQQQLHQQQQQQQQQQAQYHQQPTPPQYDQNMYHHTGEHQRGQSISGLPQQMQPQVNMPVRHSSEAAISHHSQYPQQIQTTLPPDFGSNNSAFTPELTPDVSILMGQPTTDGAFNPLVDQWMASPTGYAFDNSGIPRGNKLNEGSEWPDQTTDMADMSKWDNFAQPIAMDESWSTFINEGAWGPEPDTNMR